MVTKSPLVLVVDDELHMCNVLHRILEKEGYRVITALDGKAALQLVKERKPDAILLDIMMPGIDGREVCRRVRQLSTASRIIYLSAKVEPVNTRKLERVRNEVDAFIAKPATSKQILTTVRDVLKDFRQ